MIGWFPGNGKYCLSRRAMKYLAPEYSDSEDSSADRRKTAGECPSQLSDERTELLELQWRDGCPVEQPVLSSGDDTAGDASSPEEKDHKAGGGGPKDRHATGGGGVAVDEWWKLWREGENGGSAAAAAHGYPRIIDDLSSVNAKAAAAASAAAKHQIYTAADEQWRLWREGHGSSAPQQDSSCKNSLLPSSAASRGGGGAQRHSSEQIDHECSTLDHAIEYMKSLQQQIQVLSSSGYGMQPLLFPCVCGQQPPRPALIPGAPALYPALTPPAPPPPPPPPPATAAPLYQPVPPSQPAAAAADLAPDIVADGGAPGGVVPGLTGIIGTGLGEEMAWSPSELPFGGCARCSFRRRAGDCQGT